MRFEDACEGWTKSRLTHEEAARLLGVCDRTFRRYIDQYEEEGLEGLIDKRLSQISHRRAPVDEVMRLVDRYRSQHQGWNVRHYYSWYQREGGQRSDSWVKNTLQGADAVVKHRYLQLGKTDRGTVTRYLMKVTGYSLAQTKRLIQQYVKTGTISVKPARGNGFKRAYTVLDSRLLASMDERHDQPSSRFWRPSPLKYGAFTQTMAVNTSTILWLSYWTSYALNLPNHGLGTVTTMAWLREKTAPLFANSMGTHTSRSSTPLTLPN